MSFRLDKRSRRAIYLISATALYLVLGAFAFGFFEYENEVQLRQEIHKTRETMQHKYNFTAEDFGKLEQVVVQSIPFSAGLQWEFIGAFYFCTVVITTVGYGHSTPYTWMGKLFCMIFALIGIPLGLVMFQSVGERINYCIRTCLIKLGRFLSRRGVHFLREVKSRHLLFVSFSTGTLTIIVGTIVFHKREKWSLFDAYYYCVITLSTIGFGDYVPLQTQGQLQRDYGYVTFTLFFILFGLAIFSACVNLLILEFMAHNADIVTARTRLKRLLSLRRTASFRSSSFRDTLRRRSGGSALNCCNQQSLTVVLPTRSASTGGYMERGRYANNSNGELKRVVPPIESNGNISTKKKLRKHRSATPMSDLKQLRNNIQANHRMKPTYFTVRRLPSRYIDHLVNMEPTNIDSTKTVSVVNPLVKNNNNNYYC